MAEKIINGTLKVLLLDWGGVIGGFVTDRFIRELGMIYHAHFLEIADYFYMVDKETGMKVWEIIETKLTEEEIYELFCARFHLRPPYEIFVSAFNAGLYIDSNHWRNFVEILQKVKAQGSLLGLVSNVNHIHWKAMSGPELGYTLQFMEKSLIYPSCKIGLRKDAQGALFDFIFDDVYKKYGVPREHIFFTDDREENVRGCSRAGGNGIHFEHGNVSKFYVDLMRFGFFED